MKLAAVAASDKRTEVYRVSAGGVLESRLLAGSKWSAWSRAPFEDEAVGVAALSGWPEQIEVFVLDRRGRVWNRWWWHERGWLPEQSFSPLGQPFPSGTVRGFSAISAGEGHFNVFVELEDGRSAVLPHVEGPDGPHWRRCEGPDALGDGWWPAYDVLPSGVYRSS
jgi:hypothetical protein